jgi:simple sugar transport system ATP-binding protein
MKQRDLIALMIGKDLARVEQKTRRAGPLGAAPLVTATGLGRKRVMEPFDLEVRPGEAVGLSGLLGSGRTETAKLLIGALQPDCGKLTISGKSTKALSPRHAWQQGIAFSPEDRKAEGIFANLSVRENIVIALQAKRGWLRRLRKAEQEDLSKKMIAAMSVATPDAEKPIGQLSGGNQQKVILGRALSSGPKLLILDEPTRGIDVGAHADIVALIRKLCKDGLGLLVASSEIDELVAFSDRVAVLRDRKKIGELAGAEITRSRIIETIADEGRDA